MSQKFLILLLFQIFLYQYYSQGITRPLTQNTLSYFNTQKIENFPIPLNTFINSSQIQINGNGDYAMAVYNHSEDVLKTTVAFIDFQGNLISKYQLQLEDTTKEKLGNLGLQLLNSGEDDSVIIIFSAQNSTGEAQSIYLGILGIDGIWRRGQPIAVFHDRIFDGSSYEANINYKFNLISSARSGNIIQFIAKTEVGIDKTQMQAHNFIDISGTENLNIANNQGTVLQQTSSIQYIFSPENIHTCLDGNGLGQILCTINKVNINEGVVYLYLLHFNQGQLVRSIKIDHANSQLVVDETNIHEAATIKNQENLQNVTILRKLSEIDEFLIIMTVGENQEYIRIIRFILEGEISTRTRQISTIKPLLDSFTTKYIPKITLEIINQSQAYLIIMGQKQKYTSFKYQLCVQEINPYDLQLKGNLVQLRSSPISLQPLVANIIFKANKYKLAFSITEQTMLRNYQGNYDVNLLDLQVQENCNNLDLQKWKCLECNQGYKLNYQFQCIEGQGFNFINPVQETIQVNSDEDDNITNNIRILKQDKEQQQLNKTLDLIQINKQQQYQNQLFTNQIKFLNIALILTIFILS